MMPYSPQTNYTAVCRPINQMESARLLASFNMLRRGSVAVGIVSMGLTGAAFVLSDPIFLIFPLLFGLIAVGMAVQVAQYRRKAAVALQKGAVTEIQGFPVSSLFAGRIAGWAIGPIVVADPRQIIFRQGVLATVACIPELRLVLTVNGNPLPYTVQMKGPRNIEPTQAYPQQQGYPQR